MKFWNGGWRTISAVVNDFASVGKFASLVFAFIFAGINLAHATLIDYKFTITEPLYGISSEAIGGPVVFDFVVDANAPNLNPPEGAYGFGNGSDGYASITIGGSTTFLQGGSISINKNQNGAVFNGYASGFAGGPLINGRTLFIADFSLFDASGQMINGMNLPLELPHIYVSEFDLQFYPLASETGYPKFGEWVEPGAVTLTISEIPIPHTIVFFASGLGVLGLLGWHRRRKTSVAYAASAVDAPTEGAFRG
jgi:hypothetical protein